MLPAPKTFTYPPRKHECHSPNISRNYKMMYMNETSYSNLQHPSLLSQYMDGDDMPVKDIYTYICIFVNYIGTHNSTF